MERIEGKKVVIYYEDIGKVSRKDGVLSSVSDTEYILNKKIIIPKLRVVRVEVIDDD